MPRNGKLWTEDEVTCALFLRHIGFNDADIAATLGRTERSVGGKIGRARTTDQTACVNNSAALFEAARPRNAVLLGQRADDMLALLPAMGSA